jgi:D-3-phosphoglycerate dehydrogenase
MLPIKKVLITTVPFADKDNLPLKLLRSNGVDYILNPNKKKLTADELATLIPEIDVLIAGTEEINTQVLKKAKKLKFISRVGIGLDNVDLNVAKELGILVSYTPDAPATAVAELTMGNILALLRLVHVSNTQMHNGHWNRYFGRRLAKVTVGIIGAGRIGANVLRHLAGFNPELVLVNDIAPNKDLNKILSFQWSSKERIYSEADVISVHVPLTSSTRNMIDKSVMLSMKNDAVLINTSRGGIVNETDLYQILKSGHLSGAAVDVFEQEPYDGPLKDIERCILTSHMGSMSVDCRNRMEIEATEEVIRFLNGRPLLNEVPESEYEEQKRKIY